MKLAFVVPWYGKRVPGGAEAEAYRTIAQLSAAGYSVEVFTTCIRDFFADWSTNFYRPGTTVEDGIPVHRFPVMRRNKAQFDLVNQKIMGDIPITPAEQITFANEFVKSPKLLEALRHQKNNYLFFFIPYLFPSAFDGVPLVGANSLIIPCLHDEGYARLEIVHQMMKRAGGLIFHTESEQKMAQSLYDLPADQIQTVLGEGVDESHLGDGEAFRQKYDITSPYILYAGRKDPGKNIPQLLYYWSHFDQIKGNVGDVQLVLIGEGDTSSMGVFKRNVIDLGYVSAEDKRNAFAGASLFCHPSTKESFSLVLMEAWQNGCPVLVNGFSSVLVEHVHKSQGGLYYVNREDFATMIDWILDHPEEAAQMGANGQTYVAEQFNWDVIIGRYIELIDQMAQTHQLDIERT